KPLVAVVTEEDLRWPQHRVKWIYHKRVIIEYYLTTSQSLRSSSSTKLTPATVHVTRRGPVEVHQHQRGR
ncbi:hypothetical protein LTS01_011057, partial [Friedmanniomyces endolithicus]